MRRWRRISAISGLSSSSFSPSVPWPFFFTCSVVLSSSDALSLSLLILFFLLLLSSSSFFGLVSFPVVVAPGSVLLFVFSPPFLLFFASDAAVAIANASNPSFVFIVPFLAFCFFAALLVEPFAFESVVVDGLPFLVDPFGLPGLPVPFVFSFLAPTLGGVNPVVVVFAIFCMNCCPKFAKFGLLPPKGFCINPSMLPGVIPATPAFPPFAIPDWKNIVLNISNDATFGIPLGGSPPFTSVGDPFVKSCPDPLRANTPSLPPPPPAPGVVILLVPFIIACACAAACA
mmetsp:Transcript_2555/g.7860  ORF Transcript_2555/g.7860 Transcript_2555/m.7860 type:complete len:287 (+) Transcript_2555:853-1713(+)